MSGNNVQMTATVESNTDRTVHIVTYDDPYGDVLVNKHMEYVLCR